MSYWQALVYGMLQGATEFLPVSSSAHLALLPWLLGWRDPGLSFDVALHMGTLAALMAYFRHDWVCMASGVFSRDGGVARRNFVLLVLASIPAALAGVFLEAQAEVAFRRPQAMASTLILFALLMEGADRMGAKKGSLNEMTLRQAVGMGLAQALAVVPGVSRSGATLTAGLFLGLTPAAAARFSFLMAAPIIFGAGVFKLRHFSAGDMSGPFFLSVGVSALMGWACIGFFLNQLPRWRLRPYVVYRVLLGLLILGLT
ncbi:MAG: undecaprenyl-diphosphate phosphatase [Elusimicrobia bacterium]|nr:undecaprenyl-diphosphate phosphatase [Elusimicrobiota bacterium]